MLRYYLTLYLTAMLMLAGCAGQKTTPTPTDTVKQAVVADGEKIIAAEPAARPEWLKFTSGGQKGEMFQFIGEASRLKSREEAKNGAVLSALSEVSQSLGVKVEMKITRVQEVKDGEYSYSFGKQSSITGKPITLNQFRKEAFYVEKWQRGGFVEFDAKVLILVPAKEVARLKREVKGLCGWGIVAPNERVYAALEKDLIKGYLAKKRYKLIPDGTKVTLADKTEDLYNKSESALFFLVKYQPQEPKKKGRKWLAAGKISFELISLTSGTTLEARWREVKAAGKSKNTAQQAVLKKAMTQIQREKRQTEKDINVSPALTLSYLGKPALASLVITEKGHFVENGKNKIAERPHSDNAGLTSAFEGALTRHGIGFVNRARVDKIFTEKEVNAHKLLKRNSIHGLNIKLPANILMVGKYMIDVNLEGIPVENRQLATQISPKKVNWQQIMVKGFDLRTGTQIFQIILTDHSKGRKLNQKGFVGFCGKLLMDKIRENSD